MDCNSSSFFSPFVQTHTLALKEQKEYISFKRSHFYPYRVVEYQCLVPFSICGIFLRQTKSQILSLFDSLQRMLGRPVFVSSFYFLWETDKDIINISFKTSALFRRSEKITHEHAKNMFALPPSRPTNRKSFSR